MNNLNKFLTGFLLFLIAFFSLVFVAILIKDISINIINRDERAEWRAERVEYRKEINMMRKRRLLFNFYIDKVSLMERCGYDSGVYGWYYTRAMREIESAYLLEMKLLGWTKEGEYR